MSCLQPEAPRARRSASARLCGALLLLSCRAFPLGFYVPGEVLDALGETHYVEHLDEAALARELDRRAGVVVEPACTERSRYWRLDREPVLGPLRCEDFDSSSSAASAGLASGDLVLVKNARAQSLATTLTFGEFTFYDHMGVLVERAGRWLVCDSWPSFQPFSKADDFADRFRGGVRGTPLERFLAHYETVLVVRLPDEPRNALLASAALASLDDAIEYDPHHDPTDPRLSCSEYILMLFERAGLAAPAAPRPVSQQPQFCALLRALGFPCKAYFVPDQFAALPGAESVAWISRHPTPGRARAVEVAFELLHERHEREGRIGDLLCAEGFGFLAYRANVAHFLRWAEGWAAARGLEAHEDLRAELRSLVPLFFRLASG
jgi:hypothetical protein